MIEHTFIYKGETKTMDLSPTKAIRQKCLECSAWSVREVEFCPCGDCALFPFRFGRDPGRKKVVLSEERKAEMVRNLERGRALKN